MSDYYLGEIRLFAGSYAPQDWALCDGSTLAISSNQALYTLLGTTFGGDGRTNFCLPDLRGRLAIGMGDGPNLTPRTLGAAVGTPTVTITAAQLPTHSHSMQASSTAASQTAPNNSTILGTVAQGDVLYISPGTPVDNDGPVPMISTGGSQAHDNLMPSLGLTYIICVNGLFPTQSN